MGFGMTHRPLRPLLVACLAAGWALVAPPAGAQDQPNLSPDEQISPRQVQTIPATKPKPKPRAAPTRAVPPANAPAPGDDAATAPRPNPAPSAATATAPAAAPAAAPAGPAARAAPKPTAAGHAVACGGAFAKDSNHLKLMQAYQPNNVDFGEVAGPGGSKLNATILFPKDPKRHLEVLWNNEAARSDTSLIVITGQSIWTGPKGLKLGLTLAALEKLNGKPFKLKGFDSNNRGTVTDWQGGALASLAGGCKVGAFLRPDPKSTPEARGGVVASSEYVSTDASVKAVKPVVAEIIIGY
jgi:hypothetical protein